jgi:hypothetical protein
MDDPPNGEQLNAFVALQIDVIARSRQGHEVPLAPMLSATVIVRDHGPKYSQAYSDHAALTPPPTLTRN